MTDERAASPVSNASAGGDASVRWGSHSCHFYETSDDLLDILVPYFKDGLDSHERCLWTVYAPLNAAAARNALAHVVPDVDQRIAAGDMVIAPSTDWKLSDGHVAPQDLAQRWAQMLDEALCHGYSGLRVNAINTGGEPNLPEFRSRCTAYERSLNDLIRSRRVVVACTYSIPHSTAGEMLDVTRSHQFTVARRNGQWEVLEAPELAATKGALSRLNAQLESRVIARTRQLAEANAALERTSEQLRALAANHRSQREADEARIARELHDELGSQLTSLRWLLEGVDTTAPSAAQVEQKLHDALALTEQMLVSTRRIASRLRPTLLDDLGLPNAIEWQVQEFQRQTGIPCHCCVEAARLPLTADQSTSIYRVVQEALTNIARHAGATRVEIALSSRDRSVFVTIDDDGRGITDEEIAGRESLGLLGMRERAQLSGGTFRIERHAPHGTRVEVSIPARE